jgi:hypothetical protein
VIHNWWHILWYCLDECLNWIVACTLFGLSETLTLEWYNCKKFVITLEFDCLLRMMRILLRHSNLFMIMLYFFVYFEGCSWFANALLMPKKNVLNLIDYKLALENLIVNLSIFWFYFGLRTNKVLSWGELISAQK